MGASEGPSAPHLYSQALQLKLYQAFIFSIPILFSIILFLLFYLFYLKRRASLSTSASALPRTLTQVARLGPSNETVSKAMIEDKLPVILFDEVLRIKESQCCVCLGEFEAKEELHQLPSCDHVFHVDCIRHWLHSNSTCPLCRCTVILINLKDKSSEPSTLDQQGSDSPGEASSENFIHQNNQNDISREQELGTTISGPLDYERTREQTRDTRRSTDEASTSFCIQEETRGCQYPDSVVLDIKILQPN